MLYSELCDLLSLLTTTGYSEYLGSSAGQVFDNCSHRVLPTSQDIDGRDSTTFFALDCRGCLVPSENNYIAFNSTPKKELKEDGYLKKKSEDSSRFIQLQIQGRD